MGDESDMLFFTAFTYGPATLKIINDFTPMLGEAGEEFVVESAAQDLEPEMPYSDDHFDVSAIVAVAEESGREEIPPADLAQMLPEFAEAQLDLDLLFDAIQVNGYSNMDILDYSKPSWMDGKAGLLSAGMISLDVPDISAAIDTAFKNLISSDES